MWITLIKLLYAPLQYHRSGYGDEYDGDPPWDYGYPTLGSGDECYDEDACEDVQEAWEEYMEAVEELYG